ncbi:MAG: hypothetical protein U0457_16900 [Candidatus Sericytochromatia bacterium]
MKENKKIYLTFDFDWACDEVLLYTLDIIEKYDIYATFFVTNETKVLENFRTNNKIELGIHPNFNNLLDGKSLEGGADFVIKNFKKIIPESVSVRSHCLTQSSRILDLFKNNGFTHDCNLFIPYNNNINLKPIRHWNSMIRVPHFWEDDIFCLENINTNDTYWDVSNFLQIDGLKVFGFHPIHIYLNTDKLALYENTRNYHNKPKELFELRNNNIGINNFLVNLIIEAKKNNFEFDLIKNIF